MDVTATQALNDAKLSCDGILLESQKIRHVGYYDSFGKVLYDHGREQLEPLQGEGLEEMHILNGTAASSLVLWQRSKYLLGQLDALIMIMGKVVDLMIPQLDTGGYFLVVFDKDTPTSEVDRVRLALTTRK